MRMGVFQAWAAGAGMKWWVGGVGWWVEGGGGDQCPRRGWQRAAYVNFNLTPGRSGLGRVRSLSASLTARLPADGPVSLGRTPPAYVPAQTKGGFLRSWTQSLASLACEAVQGCSTALHSFRDTCVCNVLLMLQWERRPAHLQCVHIGGAYSDTCFQLARLLRVNASWIISPTTHPRTGIRCS